jgi:hypothetical protein
MRHLWLIFGWSALLIILLIPMSDSPRFVALVGLLVAISFIDYLLTAREILGKAIPTLSGDLGFRSRVASALVGRET